MDIYNYNLSGNTQGFFSYLPGILKYLSPYGFSILFIGNLYRFFGVQYHFYYLVAFFLKIIASFLLYLVVDLISENEKNSYGRRIVNLFVCILFLVGTPGIQNTDWVFFMIVYLASGLFLLGTYFQIKFYRNFEYKNFVFGLIGFVSALIVSPVRLFPLLFITPLIDFYMLANSKNEKIKNNIFLKIGAFFVIVVILWGSGLFGGSAFSVYSFGGWSLVRFYELFLSMPLSAVKTFFAWFGMIVLPDEIVSNKSFLIAVGILINFLILKNLFQSLKSYKQNNWKFLFGIQFFLFTLMTWYYLPTTYVGTVHRYLFLPFCCFCLWFFTSFHKSKFILFLLVILILLNFFGLRIFYNQQLKIGRSFQYIGKIDDQVSKTFSGPLKKDMLIYIDADSEQTKQSVIFGLPFKMLVFKKQWDPSFFANTYGYWTDLKNAVESRLKTGDELDQILDRVYVFKADQNGIFNETDLMREELKKDVCKEIECNI